MRLLYSLVEVKVRLSSIALYEEFRKNEWTIYEVPLPSTKRENKNNIFQELIDYIRSIPISYRHIKEYSPDIIHVHWPVTA